MSSSGGGSRSSGSDSAENYKLSYASSHLVRENKICKTTADEDQEFLFVIRIV